MDVETHSFLQLGCLYSEGFSCANTFGKDKTTTKDALEITNHAHL